MRQNFELVSVTDDSEEKVKFNRKNAKNKLNSILKDDQDGVKNEIYTKAELEILLVYLSRKKLSKTVHKTFNTVFIRKFIQNLFSKSALKKKI